MPEVFATIVTTLVFGVAFGLALIPAWFAYHDRLGRLLTASIVWFMLGRGFVELAHEVMVWAAR